MDEQLAQILRRYKSQIALDWVAIIRLIPNSKYKYRPQSELLASTEEGVLASIELIERKSYERLERYILAVSQSRIEMNFEIREVTEALIAFKEAALPYFFEEFKDDITTLQHAIFTIDRSVRYTISKFSEFFAQGQQRRLQKNLDELHEHEGRILQQKKQIEQKLREVSALIESVRIIASTLDLDTVLNIIIEQMSDLLAAEITAIFEMDTNSNDLILRNCQGPVNLFESDALLRVSLSSDVLEEMKNKQKLLNIEDTWRENQFHNTPFLKALVDLNIRSLLGVPLISQGELLGSIAVYHTKPYKFSENEISLAQTFSNYAALAIKNARLFNQSHKAAILEERNRLAREIHDNLAQGITAIVLQLEFVSKLLVKNPDQVAEELEKTKIQARKNLAEARRSVWDLRAGDSEILTLLESIKREIEKIKLLTTAEIHFHSIGEIVIFLSEANNHLLRIFQESINNVVQHAKAQNIWITLHYDDDTFTLSISDDGIGLRSIKGKPLQSQKGFGLLGMQERARILNGKISIESSIDQGTTVTLKIPVADWKI